MLNARQLALKFIANVTYGYCGATFSGRMPCVEMADAIVQTGRETLEKVIISSLKFFLSCMANELTIGYQDRSCHRTLGC